MDYSNERGQIIYGDTGEVIDQSIYPFVRNPFHRLRVQTFPVGESMTQQQHGESVDVNRIVKRYTETGQIPTPNAARAQYADVTELQGDTTELINRSRDTLVRVEEGMKTAEKRRQAAAKPVDSPAPAVSPAPSGAPPATPAQ